MRYNFDTVSVLVVEDIRMMQDLMSYALNALGIKNILKAGDCKTAYELYKLHNPDIVLCDWQMPGANGLELVKKIRHDQFSQTRTVPIIMVTGYASETYVRKARDAGVNEFLVKPFMADTLAAKLAAVIERPKAFVESQSYFGPNRRRKKTDRPYFGPMRRFEDQQSTSQWSVDV